MNAQNTFHKIYFFEDSFEIIHNIFPTDSGYYFASMEYSMMNQRFEPLFGRLKLDGSLDWNVRNQDLSYDQNSWASRTELKPNSDGNFTLGYTNNGVIRLLTYTKNGIEVLDTVYSNLLSNDSLIFFDLGSIMTVDSNYYAYFTYYDELNDFDQAQGDGEQGVILAKLSKHGDTLWTHKFHNPLNIPFKPRFGTAGCYYNEIDNVIHMIVRESDFAQQEQNEWAKLHYYVVDTDGNILTHFERQDTQRNYGWAGLLITDSIVIYSNFVSEYTIYPGSTQYNWYYRPVITAIDTNNNFLWKDTLSYDYIQLGSQYIPNKYVKSTDTTFAGAFTFFDFVTNEDTSEFYTLYNIEFFNKDIETGENVWERHYRYFPEDSMSRHEHQIIDIERTYDDGYIMSGSVYSMDSSQAGRPHTYGYIIKTNCLGFLGNPQASFSYSFNENDELIITNTSTQAGGYQWSFGDNSTLMTGENETSISHSYSSNGQYEVELIAYGCDNNNDTTRVTIDVEMKDPGFAGDGSLLTLFPNPTKTGQSTGFYIGKINGEATIQVVNSAGQLVSSFRIPAGETTYLFPCSYSAGTYFFQLTQGSAILEVEKLVVE